MHQLLWAGTLFVMIFCSWTAFSKCKDPFLPAVVVLLPFSYAYVIWPYLNEANQELSALLGEERLVYVSFYYFCAITAFFVGLIHYPCFSSRSFSGTRSDKHLFGTNTFSPVVRRRLFAVAVFLGSLSILAYSYGLLNVGGLVEAYSRSKGGGVVGSGYVGEAVLLSYPAIFLVSLSAQGTRRIGVVKLASSLLFAAPQLLQGTLGGRRGPLFLSLTVLYFAWHIAKNKLPKLLNALISFTLIGFLVLFVLSQRQAVFIGSGESFQLDRLSNILTPERIEDADFIAGASTILVYDQTNNFTWGRDYLVDLFVRPIPRQLWPQKYEDAANLIGYRVVEGGGDWEYFTQVLGFAPPKGSSVGVAASLYTSFSWLALFAIYFLGRFLSFLWMRHKTRGGIWTIFFCQSMILSIYLPTQSFSAFYQRLILIMGVTIFVFTFIIPRSSIPSVSSH